MCPGREIINTLPSDTHRTNLSIKRGRTQCALEGEILILYLVTPIVEPLYKTGKNSMCSVRGNINTLPSDTHRRTSL